MPLSRRRFLASLLFSPTLALGAVRAGECPPSVPDLTGKWSGRWSSDTSGHSGPLRARFREISDCQYRVTFSGRFWVVVPFLYPVTLDVTGYAADKVLLSGSSRLGPVLGTFTYSAESTATDFVATFESRNDRGSFVLSRCA